MAQPNLESFALRGLISKIEVTEGTDSVPVVATNGINLFEGRSGTEFDKKERNLDRPFFGGRPFGVANKRAFIEGGVEIFSPLTPGQVATGNSVIEAILLPAGFTVVKDALAKTTRYNPISSGIPTASHYWWHVDAHKKVLGARNQLSQIAMQIGERFMAQVRIQGSYVNVTEQMVPSNIVVPQTVPTILDDLNGETHISCADLAISDLLLWGKSLIIDMGSQLATKQFTSKKVNQISGRTPTFTLRCARADLSDINPDTIKDAGYIITGNIRMMETAVLYSELGFRGQIESFQEVDIDGDKCWELSGPCIPSSAGGDEFYIEHGDLTP